MQPPVQPTPEWPHLASRWIDRGRLRRSARRGRPSRSGCGRRGRAPAPAATLIGSWRSPLGGEGGVGPGAIGAEPASPATTARVRPDASAPRSGSTASTVCRRGRARSGPATCSAEAGACPPARHGGGGAARAIPRRGAIDGNPCGAPNEGLVRLDHAAHRLARRGRRPQEPVPPAKAGRQVHAAMGGRLARLMPRRERLTDAASIFLAQPRKEVPVSALTVFRHVLQR